VTRRRRIFITAVIVPVMVVVAGCASAPSETVPTPTGRVLVDSVFSAQALLDTNGNGQIDSGDTPIVNATFYVEVNGVKAFGATTDEKGHAFILIPGGVEYPVNVSMEAPKDSTLKPITPSTVTLSTGAGNIQVLFSSSETK